MKLVLFSDTHGQHHFIDLPEGDVAIFCGDFGGAGTMAELEIFLRWFNKQPHKYKIMIGGNHDKCLEVQSFESLELLKDFPSIFYLEDSWVKIDGVLFYGSPYTMWLPRWSFQIDVFTAKAHWSQIPLETDVLITHGPPKNILDAVVYRKPHEDGFVGDPILRDRITELPNLKLHCFGHIHESYGSVQKGNVHYINCSVLDHKYDQTNKPVVFEIPDKG